MPTTPLRRHVTDRDTEILLALDRCPLTVQQILKVSQTFPGRPFGSPRSVQDRLQKLRHAGWVRSWRYATTNRGAAPDYYKLTLLGYRLLYGPDAQPPTKRHFAEVGIAHQHHTHALADFIVHTAVCAHRANLRMANFSREHTLRLTVADESLFPDCAFELHTPDRLQFNFLVELDNGTERVRSDKDTESWQRKSRLYEQLQDTSAHRFRVLVVTTRSSARSDHILALAAGRARNPRRSLLYAIHLADYLRSADALHQPCFRDHRGSAVSLIPTLPSCAPRQTAGSPSGPPPPPAGKLIPLPAAFHP
jgi:hypothetical protein